MSEDSSFNKNKPQMNTNENRCGIDLFGSLGKGMLAKAKLDTLGNSSGLTPISFGVNVNNIMDRENSELKRTRTNSENMSSFGVRKSSLPNFSFKTAENTDLLNNSTCLETLKNSSGLTPLNHDSEPPMDTGKCINSPQRNLRSQSLGIINFSFKGE